jgi:hypothetical protein
MASYVDIIEGVNLKDQKVLTLPPFTLVSKYWVKDGIASDQTLNVEVSRKIAGKTNRTVLQEMSFPLDTKGENILIQLDVENLVLEEAGLWEIEVRWKLKDNGSWKKGTTIPLKVDVGKV